MKEIDAVFKEQIEIIKPSKEELEEIKKISREFIEEISSNLKKNKIKAEVFAGGSLAKNTLVKKDYYDIDIFVRFDKSYKNISSLLGNIIKNSKKVHGSRDYYQVKKNKVFIEIIPVIKIESPEKAENVTDLSYFHVKYVLNKIEKNKNLINEICLVKSFSHAQNVYGAESYINGFSGYALELLIIHYETFLNFIKEIVKLNNKSKLIIDDEKHFINKKALLIHMNPSKTNSPIILVDPTYKERNALSSLSEETLIKFQKSCKSFLKNPSVKFFMKKNIADDFKSSNSKIVLIRTNKQSGDIAGTKSKKFYKFLLRELRKEFNIKKEGFEYIEEENLSKGYLLLKKKFSTEIKGPPVIYEKNVREFKLKHKNYFIKDGYIYSVLEHKLSFNNWLEIFKKNNRKTIKQMGVIEVK